MIPGLLHILTLINFYQAFFNTNISVRYFVFFVISRCVEAYFGWQDDECLSMYIITTIPHGKCVRTVFTLELLTYHIIL